jgi:hypothetical protein
VHKAAVVAVAPNVFRERSKIRETFLVRSNSNSMSRDTYYILSCLSGELLMSYLASSFDLSICPCLLLVTVAPNDNANHNKTITV